MDHNLPLLAKRVWKIIRAVLFMARKGLSKTQLMLDLNMMIKRGKIAGKALTNLIFHHHDRNLSFSGPTEYEFSCSNSPAYFSFHLSKRRHRNQDYDLTTLNAVVSVLEKLNSNTMVEVSSPALQGFGRSPAVRQLRITDSPFPLQDVEENSQVDKAADEFIKKFYRQLKQQNIMSDDVY